MKLQTVRVARESSEGEGGVERQEKEERRTK